ncbi:MAG: toll/interleukin-1 receptor domain-containing protein [Lachnospiraceae bacterium]|nr:toll/interleukin-1 receptor domain-containing protein [Lachnospiraceae bacterium]
MSTIFLSHTSVDKPFVEKLAKDLKNLGINVWYDKYQIKVGESILWKIDEGIKESEYLGIVISQEALKSEWVKTEITAAWQKQIERKGKFILPIYYRECEIPLFLQGIKYADFRKDYKKGLEDLISVFGIKSIEAITGDNWRMFVRRRGSNWKNFRDKEFESVITGIYRIAKENNFSMWVGGTKNPYSFNVNGWINKEMSLYISVRMAPDNGYKYMAANTREINPQNVGKENYIKEIGCTINEVEEYIYNEIKAFVEANGKPVEKTYYFTEKSMSIDKKIKIMVDAVKSMDWNQDK